MNTVAGYSIRPLTPADQTFLWEMLYQSLHVPLGGQPFAREIVHLPEIARYVQDWGGEHDAGFVAVDKAGRSIGAVWLRLFGDEGRGYGYVDERTPEIGMAVLPEYRGRGVGTESLGQLLRWAEGKYDCVSLSVGTDNPARRLYERMGFKVVRESGDSLVMKKKIESSSGGGAT